MDAISTELQMKIASLQDAIINTHPTLPIILKEIHTTLKNDPATVTLLSEADISTIVNGLMRQTKVSITESATKKRTVLKNVSLADL